MPYNVRLGTDAFVESGAATDAYAFAVEQPAGTVVYGITPLGAEGGLVTPTSVLATGNTITPTGNAVIFTTGGAVTGVIMAAGSVDGQEFTILNNSANSITFAAVGTSRVADGASAVIAANTRMTLVWSAAASLWFHGN